MDPIKLTAKQIEFWEEFAADNEGARAVIDRAFRFYANRMNELRKQKDQWYKEFRALHNLDAELQIRVTQRNGVVVVVEVDDEDSA